MRGKSMSDTTTCSPKAPLYAAVRTLDSSRGPVNKGLLTAPPPPSEPGLRVGRLHNMAGVRRELARVYREARKGVLSVADAAKLGNLLAILARIIETSTLETRVKALEDKQRSRA